MVWSFKDRFGVLYIRFCIGSRVLWMRFCRFIVLELGSVFFVFLEIYGCFIFNKDRFFMTVMMLGVRRRNRYFVWVFS